MNAAEPWTLFLSPGHFNVPYFFPTVDARASPMPKASTPHNENGDGSIPVELFLILKKRIITRQ